MRKSILRLTLAAVATGMAVAVMATPALGKGNPNGLDNPYAGFTDYDATPACVYVYKAPPAYGFPIGYPNSPTPNAAGGNPGYVWQEVSHGGGC